MSVNIPDTGQKRVVILGAGFGGLKLARELSRSDYQVVIIDRNNFHQFQPLFYQVAMAGLEPSTISFPLRKIFQKNKNVKVRVAEVESVDLEEQIVFTSIGKLGYDKLVIALGATSNFYGNSILEENCLTLKSVADSLQIRNQILEDLEQAISELDYNERQKLIDIVIVGGGPTGVEVAGALAEMRRFIIPKDYPEINPEEIDIYLVQGAPRLLPAMKEKSSADALKFLDGLGVKVKLNSIVVDYRNGEVLLSSGDKIPADKVIWAAGVVGNRLEGIPENLWYHGRIMTDQHCRIPGFDDVFVVGDLNGYHDEYIPHGFPQVAQTALQQGKYVAKYLKKGKLSESGFKYKDLGSLATIGRAKAVADLPGIRISGWLAWIVWLFVHLFQLIGVRNRVVVFINWMTNYFTYDQSLRLIIRANPNKKKKA